MTTEKHNRETETLGQFLKSTRVAQGFDLAEIVEETRISASNLKAMEADDYAALPADAFSRGFYTIYARKLQLDPETVLARFRAERGLNPRKGTMVAHNPPAHKAAQQVSNMAEPSAVSPLSTIGYVLLMLIILAGGLCWYFGINPATYISEQLRSLQSTETQTQEPGGNGSSQPAAGGTKDQGSTVPLQDDRAGSLAAAATFSSSRQPHLPQHQNDAATVPDLTGRS